MAQLKDITPVVLIGGAGSRLWPLSRANKPKQFLNLTGEASMFQDTVTRFAAPGFGPAWLLANADTLRHAVAQLEGLDAKVEGFIVEPAMRGTAAAIAAIVCVANRADPDALLLIAPADHYIRDEANFRDAVLRAAPLAEDGMIVTFGITPTAPETGFGYIAGSAPLSVDGTIVGHRIGAHGFHEKPDLETARRFVADGYLWNAGIFLFKASAMLDELEQFAPQTLAAVRAACMVGETQSSNGRQIVTPRAAEFSEAPLELSIDVAVMEKTDRAAVVPCSDIGWSDVGSLSALWEIAPQDAQGNAARGDALFHDARNVYAHSSAGRKIVAAHLSDILIVDTADALIVLPSGRAQSVKTIVNALKSSGAAQLRYQDEAQFAWGDGRVDHTGPSYSALTVTIQSGETLKRSASAEFETWTVVGGSASVTLGTQHWLLRSGESFSATPGELMSIAALDGAARLAILTSPLASVDPAGFLETPASSVRLAGSQDVA